MKTAATARTISEIFSALAAEKDRNEALRLAYQLETLVANEKPKLVEFLQDSTKELARAHQLVKLVDSMAHTGHITKEVTKTGNALDALVSHSYHYAKVALATTWLEYLTAINEQIRYITMLDDHTARPKAIAVLVSMGRQVPEVNFTSGAPLQASSRFKRVERELQKIHQEYGLYSLYAHEVPRDLAGCLQRAAESLDPLWSGSPSYFYHPTEGDGIQTVIFHD